MEATNGLVAGQVSIMVPEQYANSTQRRKQNRRKQNRRKRRKKGKKAPFSGACVGCQKMFFHKKPYFNNSIPDFDDNYPKCVDCRSIECKICQTCESSMMINLLSQGWYNNVDHCSDCRKTMEQYMSRKEWQRYQRTQRRKLDPFEYDCTDCSVHIKHTRPYFHKTLPVFDKSRPKCVTCRAKSIWMCKMCPSGSKFTGEYDLRTGHPSRCDVCTVVHNNRIKYWKYKDSNMPVPKSGKVLKIVYERESLQGPYSEEEEHAIVRVTHYFLGTHCHVLSGQPVDSLGSELVNDPSHCFFSYIFNKDPIYECRCNDYCYGNCSEVSYEIMEKSIMEWSDLTDEALNMAGKLVVF
jgi:hypothetical protein